MKFDFHTLQAAELTAEEFCFVQDRLLNGVSNEELGEMLGYPSREKGRKIISSLRKGRTLASPPIVTALWFLVYADEVPAWAGESE